MVGDDPCQLFGLSKHDADGLYNALNNKQCFERCIYKHGCTFSLMMWGLAWSEALLRNVTGM